MSLYVLLKFSAEQKIKWVLKVLDMSNSSSVLREVIMSDGAMRLRVAVIITMVVVAVVAADIKERFLHFSDRILYIFLI